MTPANRLHVLHVIDSLGLGGAERMLVDIANATVADGHRVSVCVTRSTTTLAKQLDERIELLVLHRRRRFSANAIARLAAWARRQRVDVLHVHLRSSLSFVLLLRALRLIDTPVVFHDHYGTIEVDASIPTWFRLLHRYVDRYVGVYEMLSAWAQRAGIAADKTITIPNVLDLGRLRSAQPVDVRSQLGLAVEIPIALAVATLRKDKALEVLLDAVAQSQYRGRIRVLVAGADGEPEYARHCRARCAELGLDDTVTFLGPRTDVPGLLLAADVALLSSHTESGPLVLIEYLAAGLPIVSTLVGDIGHRLAASDVPGFVPAGDAAGFARELDAVLALSPGERRERGALGRRIVDHTWDVRAAMPRWYSVYRAAVAAHA